MYSRVASLSRLSGGPTKGGGLGLAEKEDTGELSLKRANGQAMRPLKQKSHRRDLLICLFVGFGRMGLGAGALWALFCVADSPC